MDLVENYSILISKLRGLAAFCGADVLDKQYKVNFRTSIVFTIIALFNIFSVYTIYFGWGDIGMIFKSLTIWGCAIQGMVKMYSGITYAPTIRDLEFSLRNLYVKNHKHEEKNKILERCYKICNIIVSFVFVSHFATPVLTFLYPIYTQVILHKNQLILTMIMPGITTDTIIGYQIYNCVHTTLIFIGSLGIIVSDLFFALLIMHSTVYVSFFNININDLNKLLINNDKSDNKIQIQLKHILDEYNDILTYMSRVNNSHKLNCFVEIVTNLPCLCITLFLIIVEKWIIGYIMVLILFYKIVLYCTFGTIIEMQNEKTTTAIYNSSWHLLSILDQKTIMFMLHRSQSPIELTIGGIANLNMQTCMQIIKSIYSFLMMLLNFINN